ncbi:MAG: metallopeptidase family protein [Lachnospiraceae bacterium]
MISQEEFMELLDEISGEIPSEIFQGLNGGVILRPEEKLHPQSQGNDLWVLGDYNRNQMGRYINIYYGSYSRVYGHLEGEALRKKLRHTLLHEFRHHLESLAGEYDLEVEDAIQIAKYKQMYTTKQEEKYQDNETDH